MSYRRDSVSGSVTQRPGGRAAHATATLGLLISRVALDKLPPDSAVRWDGHHPSAGLGTVGSPRQRPAGQVTPRVPAARLRCPWFPRKRSGPVVPTSSDLRVTPKWAGSAGDVSARPWLSVAIAAPRLSLGDGGKKTGSSPPPTVRWALKNRSAAWENLITLRRGTWVHAVIGACVTAVSLGGAWGRPVAETRRSGRHPHGGWVAPPWPPCVLSPETKPQLPPSAP